jgi:hypothetical protein
LWTVVAALLLLPLAAMQFTDEVAWDAADFAAAAILLVGAGLGLELVFRMTSRPLYRAALSAAILGAAGLIWADAAVGVF